MSQEETRKKVQRLKQKALEREKKELKRQSRIFQSWPGKALKVLSLLVALLSLTLIIDTFLEVEYKTHNIVDAEHEIHNLVSQDGKGVHAKYYHVYLDEARDLDVFMYKYEYYVAIYENTLGIGSTPIFHIPRRFRVGSGDFLIDKPLEYNMATMRILPTFLLVLSIVSLFMNFGYNYQTIAFGHINFVAMPAALVVLLVITLSGFSERGQYTMDVSAFQLRSVDQLNAAKARVGIENN